MDKKTKQTSFKIAIGFKNGISQKALHTLAKVREPGNELRKQDKRKDNKKGDIVGKK
jgi:hypothetical protein